MPTDRPYIPIPRDKLPGMIGKPIHLSWANFGCVWILCGIRGDVMDLETPKTHRRRTSYCSAAVYTRANEPQQPAEGEEQDNEG